MFCGTPDVQQCEPYAFNPVARLQPPSRGAASASLTLFLWLRLPPSGVFRVFCTAALHICGGLVHISADRPAAFCSLPTASLRNGVRRLLPMPASSGLSIHGGGARRIRFT